MASNVLVFENLPGEAGRNRCRELIQKEFSMGVRTLVTVPALLIVGFLLAWLVGGMVFEAFYSFGFWVLIAVIFWIIIPASGAVNTFLYLYITKSK
jgi:membrane protein required for beta-lactamase induction